MRTTQALFDDGQKTDYAGQLEGLSDDDFVKEVSEQILAAGYSPRMTVADEKASIGYTEAATRREKPWLYAQAWNRAARAAGVDLDASDYARARPPVAAAA